MKGAEIALEKERDKSRMFRDSAEKKTLEKEQVTLQHLCRFLIVLESQPWSRAVKLYSLA